MNKSSVEEESFSVSIYIIGPMTGHNPALICLFPQLCLLGGFQRVNVGKGGFQQSCGGKGGLSDIVRAKAVFSGVVQVKAVFSALLQV